MSALEAVVSFAHKLGMLIYLALKPAMVVTYSGSSIVFFSYGYTVLYFCVQVVQCLSHVRFVLFLGTQTCFLFLYGTELYEC